jgi:DNA-binding MarR family transcriptional regulator
MLGNVKTTGVTEATGSPARGEPDAAFADLTWLLHRAAQRMRAALDDAARSHGLAGARDWLVLSAIAAGPPQTQLALAQTLGLDKTTLTSLLDRLEARGYVTRSLDNHDRRARIPALTPSGVEVQRRVARARDAAEAAVLCGFTDAERLLLRDLLARLASDSGRKPTGSCI